MRFGSVQVGLAGGFFFLIFGGWVRKTFGVDFLLIFFLKKKETACWSDGRSAIVEQHHLSLVFQSYLVRIGVWTHFHTS